MDCIFCKIVNKMIPTKLVYEDQWVIVFDDVFPQAPQHKLIIPRKHIANLNDIKKEDSNLLGHLIQTGKHLAKELDIAKTGYRLVLNTNPEGGQTVFHLHMHLLGGRPMAWPPG
jgi:histidine triad (HIT) family protein